MTSETEAEVQEELTGEIVKSDQGSQAESSPLPDPLTAFITSQAPEVKDSASDPMMRIVQQVLDAESADAVLTPVEVMQATEIIGIPIVLMDFDLNQSEFDAGSPFYVSAVCAFPPGDDVRVVNCGHKKVIAQCVKLKSLGALPVPVKFITRGTSKQGTPMLELTKWGPDDGPPPF